MQLRYGLLETAVDLVDDVCSENLSPELSLERGEANPQIGISRISFWG